MIWPFTHKAAPPDPWMAHPVTFVASPYKTATSTVGKAVIALGVHRREMTHQRKLQQTHKGLFKQVNTLSRGARTWARFVQNGERDQVREILAPVLAAARRFDVFADAPLGHTHIHPFARRAIAPNSKFIWVHRDPEDWLASVRRWEESHPDIYPRHVFWTSHPKRRPRQLAELWRRNLSHFHRLAEVFPEDCLELDIADLDDYTKLAAFYGVEAPDAPLKRYNVNSG